MKAVPGQDLLEQIAAEALEPEYLTTTHRGGRRRAGGLTLTVVLLLVGLMLGAAAAATARARPERSNERERLISYVVAGERSNDDLRAQIEDLRRQISTLQTEGLGTGERADSLRKQLDLLELAAGASAVTGPGITLTIDDADDAGTSGRILDVDLRQAVNGLWLAGAEAVAVNGHRIGSLTAIRTAGDAVTVDYRSLVRPYVVSAIGDPNTMPARWATSSGASWLTYLKQNYHVRYDTAQAANLTLPAVSSTTLRNATAAETPR